MESVERNLVIQIRHYRFLLCVGLVYLIALLRVVFQVNIPVVSFLLVAALMVLLLNKEELLTYMCCLLPMMGLQQIRIALVIISVGYLLRIRRYSFGCFIPFVCLVAWELLHSGQSKPDVYGLIRDFAPWFAVTVITVDKDCRVRDGFAFRALAYASLFCSFLNIIACSKQFGYSIMSLARLGNLSDNYEDFQGLINPNPNSFFCLISFCALLLLHYYENAKKSDKYLLLGLVLTIVFTQSKASILCVVLTPLLYSIMSGQMRRITVKSIRHAVILIVILLTIYVAFYDLVDVIMKRFTNGDVSTGRTMINLFYGRHVVANPHNFLFGIGEYKYTYRIKEMYGFNEWKLYPGLATMSGGELVYKPCHFAILEIIVAWGIIGLLFVEHLLGNIIHKGKLLNQEKIAYVSLIIVLIYSLQSDTLGGSSIPHALLVCMLCVVFRPRKSVVDDLKLQ